MSVNGITTQYTSVNQVEENSGLGKNDFLNILAAQLQYQDPMEGGDNSEYVAQLAQFSSLEQMENLNVTFNELKVNQNLLYGTLLIGKMVNLTFGEEMISGVVDKVKLTNDLLKLIVNGQEYSVKDVVSVEGEQVEDLTEQFETLQSQIDSIISEDVVE